MDTIVRDFGDAYPELRTGRDVVVRVIRSEEERFDAVLANGLPRLEEILDAVASGGGVVSGEAAFRLYDTFGIPLDFIEDMIEERKLTLDRDAFERAMEGQRDKARARSKFGVATAADAPAWQTRPDLAKTPDAFRGYDATSLDTRIVELLNAQRQSVEQLKKDESGFVALAETPFYLQSGGQVSDVGRITSAGGTAAVTDVVKGPADLPRFQAVTVTQGVLHRGDTVSAEVDAAARDATRRNHTATHLLHAALRQVLGGHVKQAGSLVAPDRLRFDFAHFAPLTHEQVVEIERIVNEQIVRNTPVETELKDTQEAIAAGAMALFGEKYGDRVRVVSVPDFSVELCGGTHVRATGDIGLFAIVSESGVAAGVRRVEAITGLDSVEAFQRQRDELAAARGRTERAAGRAVGEACRTAGRQQAAHARAAAGQNEGGDGRRVGWRNRRSHRGCRCEADRARGLRTRQRRAAVTRRPASIPHQERDRHPRITLRRQSHDRRRRDGRSDETNPRGTGRQTDRTDGWRWRRRKSRFCRSRREGSVEDSGNAGREPRDR